MSKDIFEIINPTNTLGVCRPLAHILGACETIVYRDSRNCSIIRRRCSLYATKVFNLADATVQLQRPRCSFWGDVFTYLSHTLSTINCGKSLYFR